MSPKYISGTKMNPIPPKDNTDVWMGRDLNPLTAAPMAIFMAHKAIRVLNLVSVDKLRTISVLSPNIYKDNY